MVYKQARGKPCSRSKPNSVRSICRSPEVDIHPGDRASRSMAKARGRDNAFSALECKRAVWPVTRARPRKGALSADASPPGPVFTSFERPAPHRFVLPAIPLSSFFSVAQPAQRQRETLSADAPLLLGGERADTAAVRAAQAMLSQRGKKISARRSSRQQMPSKIWYLAWYLAQHAHSILLMLTMPVQVAAVPQPGCSLTRRPFIVKISSLFHPASQIQQLGILRAVRRPNATNVSMFVVCEPGFETSCSLLNVLFEMKAILRDRTDEQDLFTRAADQEDA